MHKPNMVCLIQFSVLRFSQTFPHPVHYRSA